MPLNRRQFLSVVATAGACTLSSAGLAESPSKRWAFADVDRAIADKVHPRLPERIFDIHAHLYRKADLGAVCPDLPALGPDVTDADVWRECLSQVVGAGRLKGGLYIPYPVKGGNVDGGNEFLLEQVDKADFCRGLIVVTPDSDRAAMEKLLRHPKIIGFKPYHVFAHRQQTFDAVLDEYLPEWAWEMAHEHEAVILVHLVRTAALSDADNQRIILSMCAKYPKAKLILAHAGRGFHAPNTIEALPKFKDVPSAYFDCAAVCEPDALMAIIKTCGVNRLMYGSDFPVSHQRGKCVTVGDAFSWICPERIDVDPSAPPCHATLVGLEEIRALCLGAQLLDLTKADLDRIFFKNAVELLRIS